MKKEISGFENFVYYLFVFLSFGVLWVYKIMVKKAILEIVRDNHGKIL